MIGEAQSPVQGKIKKGGSSGYHRQVHTEIHVIRKVSCVEVFWLSGSPMLCGLSSPLDNSHSSFP